MLSDLVKYKQKMFCYRMINERHNMIDDPLMYAINLTRGEVPSTTSYIDSLLGMNDILLH